MSRYSLSHLLDGEVVRGLDASLTREDDARADVLAHIAEMDARKLYVPAGYESIHDYCTRRLHLSKHSAYKRITAARAAFSFPAIFERVAERALGLTVVNVLAPWLTEENADELLAAASYKTREEVQELLAEWFPQESVPTTIEPIAQPMTLAAAPESAGEPVSELAPGRVQGVVNPLQITPLATDLYKLQLTMSGAMYTKLRRAVELFGRRKPVPNEAEILELGLDLLVQRLEKKKFHATDKPRPRRPCAEDHIPAEVQRTVWERDGGQCTFVSEDGVRCAATQDLQQDHIVPKAKGGRSDDPGNIRLRCHAHNQFEAERAFGKAFMEQKREQARAAAAKRRAERDAEREEARAAGVARRKAERLAAKAAKEAADKAAREAGEDAELVEWLQMFGYSVAQAESMMAVVRRWEGRTPESRRLECLLRLREREKLASTGT